MLAETTQSKVQTLGLSATEKGLTISEISEKNTENTVKPLAYFARYLIPLILLGLTIYEIKYPQNGWKQSLKHKYFGFATFNTRKNGNSQN